MRIFLIWPYFDNTPSQVASKHRKLKTDKLFPRSIHLKIFHLIALLSLIVDCFLLMEVQFDLPVKNRLPNFLFLS